MKTNDHITVDCLKIKADAQAELQRELAGLTSEEELAFHCNYPLSKGLQDLWDSIPQAPARKKGRAA